jgi:redox-sensitive bicupin YhaK (pirin superfamily)
MKKQISFTGNGQRADIGAMTIYRILPNRYADAVGPFVFMDHIAPRIYPSVKKDSIGAHPHRGIVTLTYVLNGEDEHFDSAGNHAKVHSGGVQWMKAGNGIVHDESLNVDSRTDSNLIHSFQFWINLPSKIKEEKPEYRAIQSHEVPQKTLPGESGWIKVIVGHFEELSAEIPNYSEQFLYHVHLEPGKQFTVTMAHQTEVAAFLPIQNVTINDAPFEAGELIEFDTNEGSIEIYNNSGVASEILLFGGERYREPIVAQGPFVMNSELEIAEAYRDFKAGRYGEINYGLVK